MIAGRASDLVPEPLPGKGLAGGRANAGVGNYARFSFTPAVGGAVIEGLYLASANGVGWETFRGGTGTAGMSLVTQVGDGKVGGGFSASVFASALAGNAVLPDPFCQTGLAWRVDAGEAFVISSLDPNPGQSVGAIYWREIPRVVSP